MGAREIVSLNKTELAKISIEELKKRLEHEEIRNQCWTCYTGNCGSYNG